MRLCIFFMLFFSTFGISQSLSDTIQLVQLLDKAILLQKSFQPKEALKVLKQIEKDAIETYGAHSESAAKFYYNIASCQLDLALYEQAKSYLDKALTIYELKDSLSLALGDTYMLIGIYYDYTAYYDKALRYYDKTSHIYTQLLSPEDQRFGYLYNNIGICIFFQGDVHRALGFFSKTVAITVENTGIRNTKVSRDLTNASLCHSKLNESNKALINLGVSLEIAKQNQVLDSYVGARIYHALSIAHFELGDHNIALEYGQEAHRLRIKHFHPEHIEVAKGYYSQADIYLALGDIASAQFYLAKAKAIYQQLFAEYHPEIAFIHYKLSTIALQRNNLILALEEINTSLKLFNYDEHISVSAKDQFDHQILAAIELKAKIHFQLWQEEKNLLQLKKANKIYTDLIILFNQFRKGFKEDISKELLAENYFHIFESALEVSFELAKVTDDSVFKEQAFQRAEFSTSHVLLANIRNTLAKNKAEIPDSLLNLEQELRTEIAAYKQKLKYLEDGAEKNQNSLIKQRAQLFDAKEKHNKLINLLEASYHNYHYYKQDLSAISLEELQKDLLEPDQTLLEYFVGEKYIFVFIISSDKFILEKIEIDFPLTSWITDFRKSIIRYQFPFNLPANYHENLVDYSANLYNALIQPISKHLNKRLIIIPGGPLAEIPFECLIKEPAKNPAHYKKHHYLINDYAISYCYSATLLKEMINSKPTTTQHKAIAFAPSFNNFNGGGNLRGLSLLPLKYNDDEVEAIQGIIDIELLYGQDATESQFLEAVKSYNIIHFASHAQANNDNGEFSFLAFSEVKDNIENELLFVKDIYNIPLKAEMVTLSACETGIGENRKGEGIISLARSFAYSGTRNINTSLWKVNDQRMSELMQYFYQNIQENKYKDQSLQEAKLQLIKKQDTHANTHPFYWSPMITIGDTAAVKLSPNRSYWLWVLAGATLLLFSLFLKKRKIVNA